jgi:phosphatidylglycerol:prolipoprotein diacylglycerol transferase
MSSNVWVHNLNPFIIQLGDNFGLRWYGMAYMMGFVAGAAVMIFMARRGRRTINVEQVTDFVTYCVLGVMIGGRLGYVFFYSPDLLTSFKAHLSLVIPGTNIGIQTDHFWSALAVWEGGMASHGGIIGLMLASFLFARKFKLDWLHLGDLTCIGGTIGIFCGRVANFVNGELMGREASADLPWAVKFPTDMHRWLGYEPEKLASLKDAASKIGIAPDQWSEWVNQYRVNSQASSQVQAVVDRLILEVQKHNSAVTDALAQVLPPRHPSQLYEALLEGMFLFIVLFLFWRKPRKPGVVGALFLTLYSVVRIIGENFRMPDAHIAAQEFSHLGITRGQLLSFGQFLLSAAFLFWVSRRKVEVISGWGPEAQALKAQEDAAQSKMKKPRLS